LFRSKARAGQCPDSALRHRGAVNDGELDRVVVRIPAMSSRHDLRVIAARIRDVPGVVAVAVDLEARTIQILGAVDVEEVATAIAAAGYQSAV
jgi:copper chaperone CopZ